MRYLRLCIQNFGSFGDEQELDLVKRGLTFIEGENKDDDSADNNGAGKSTIPNAWIWVLFGKTLKEGMDADEVVNNVKKRNCRVSLSFQDDTGTTFKVVRYRRDSRFKNALELYQGKTRITERSSSATQRRIEALVGIDYKSFAGILCGQGINQPFSKLTDAEMKAVLDKVANTEDYPKAAKVAKDKESKARSEHVEILHAIDKAEAELANAKESIRKLRAEIASTKKLKRTADETEIKTQLFHIKALKSLIAKGGSWRSELKMARGADEELKRKIVVVDTQIETLARGIRKLEASKISGGTCESCGSRIEPGKVEGHLKDKREELATLKRQASGLADAKAAAAKLVKRFDAKVTELEGYDASLTDRRRRLAEARASLERAEPARHSFDALLASAKRSGEVAARTLKVLKRKRRELDRRIAVYRFWVEGYGNKGIKSLMLDSVVPFLNRKVARFASILTNGNMRIWFETQSKLKTGEIRDNFAVRVKIKAGGTSYASSSGGESTKVDLCVSRAFQALLAVRNRAALNVIFLDEIFDRLDNVSLDHAVSLVTEDLNTYESVFLISHRPDLKVYFPNSIKVVKEKGISRIEA